MTPSEQTEIVITAAGGPEVLKARRAPTPEPGDDGLLIRVRAAGINRHDIGQRRRGPGPGHSDVPGLEVAGDIVAIGRRAKGWAIGDRVCALTDGGGYAEYAAAHAAHAFRLPADLDFAQAAALPEALFTIWHNFFTVAAMGPGESALLHGGTSGVGTIAIQLLTALGHPVFATCGSPEKVAVAERLGAVKAFDYKHDDFLAGVRQHSGGRGVDVILDMSGGRYSAKNVEALAMRGRSVHLSPGDGADFTAPLRAIMAKEAKVTGSLLRPLPEAEKSIIAAKLRAHAWPLVAAGRVRPFVRSVYPLADAARAHTDMDASDHWGKLILMSDGSQG
jgi:putative PIG3 family NAD(P)H quinone oxidoreductase